MLTIFDKYLLERLFQTFAVFLVAAYGLYIVIDLFSNIDSFQLSASSHMEMAQLILRFYGFRIFEFFELAGPILIVLSAITVYGLLEKHSESHPVLAAGIPAFRLVRPMLIGGGLLNLLLVINQEFILPELAVELQTRRGATSAAIQTVEPVYDYLNYMMHIDGREVVIEERKIVAASFFLPTELASQSYSLEAESAIYLPAGDDRPSGWLLQNLKGLFDTEMLTEEGRKRILPAANGKDVFITSDVSFDQLYNRGRNLKLLSSAQLIERIRNPSTGIVPVKAQALALHARVTRPILSLLSIAMALPLVMRRESRSLIMNMTICAAVMSGFYIMTQASLMLGGSAIIRPDLAAWFPVIVTGGATMWTAGYVQT